MHFPMITLEQFDNFIRQPYAWPGGYEIHALTLDGGCLCHQCCKAEAETIADAMTEESDPQWMIAALDINYECEHLFCDHCNRQIEPEYSQG